MTDRPTVSRTVDHIEFRRIPDDDPDLSWLEQTDDEMGEGFEESARERLAAYGSDWWCVGVTAALIATDGREIDESPGVWGIESDSDHAHFDEIADQECAYLASVHDLSVAELSALPNVWVDR